MRLPRPPKGVQKGLKWLPHYLFGLLGTTLGSSRVPFWSPWVVLSVPFPRLFFRWFQVLEDLAFQGPRGVPPLWLGKPLWARFQNTQIRPGDLSKIENQMVITTQNPLKGSGPRKPFWATFLTPIA
jgi:hypothetical protein